MKMKIYAQIHPYYNNTKIHKNLMLKALKIIVKLLRISKSRHVHQKYNTV